MSDNVNHPSHYADKAIEVIVYIKDTLPPEVFSGYLWGNVIKYISRWHKKGGVEDLEKCKVYLDWLINAEKERTGLGTKEPLEEMKKYFAER